MNLRDDVNRALEQARNEKVIGKSLEAKVVIGSNESFNTAEFYNNLMTYNNYSSFHKLKLKIVNDGVSYQYGDIHIKHAEGENVKDAGTIQKN